MVKVKSCFSIVFALLVIRMALATAVLAKDTKVVPVVKANSSKAKAKVKPQAQGQAVPKIILPEDYLSASYYQNSCPNLEGIIQQKLNAWIQRDYTMAASIIRLHFHDCAVRGCDASILLNHAGSERTAEVSKTLRGFQVIDEIKAEVEKRCPKTVSCADILTAAARDATVMAGGPFWEVPFGRKDGRVSIAKEANMVVPQGHENVTALIEFFQARGLDILDLVILSGAHTIGRSSCYSIRQRLVMANSFPSMDIDYLNYLKRKCRSWNSTSSTSTFVDLDATTPRIFDAIYYTNLDKKMGLLSTDQLLLSDARTAPLVDALASQPQLFTNQFAVSMVNLGNVQLLTRVQGEIRLDCNYAN